MNKSGVQGETKDCITGPPPQQSRLQYPLSRGSEAPLALTQVAHEQMQSQNK